MTPREYVTDRVIGAKIEVSDVGGETGTRCFIRVCRLCTLRIVDLSPEACANTVLHKRQRGVLPSPLLSTPNSPQPQPVIFFYPELPLRFTIYAQVELGFAVVCHGVASGRGGPRADTLSPLNLAFIQPLMHWVAEFPDCLGLQLLSSSSAYYGL